MHLRFRRRPWQAILPLLAFMMLAGCATTLTRPGQDSTSPRLEAAWQAHDAQVRQIQNDWSCVGRAAIREGNRGGTVDISWSQQGNLFHIRLSAPLDQGVIDMSGDIQHMLIADGQGHRELTAHPQETLHRLTGWELPVTALPDWILGLPHDRVQKKTLDHHGRLATLSENGWMIQYDHYRFIDNQVFLPGLIELSKGDLHVKLLIRQWSLHAKQ